MKFIELTNHQGFPVYLDPKHIIAIDGFERCTDILVTGGNSVLCTETPFQVLKKIQECEK